MHSMSWTAHCYDGNVALIVYDSSMHEWTDVPNMIAFVDVHYNGRSRRLQGMDNYMIVESDNLVVMFNDADSTQYVGKMFAGYHYANGNEYEAQIEIDAEVMEMHRDRIKKGVMLSDEHAKIHGLI